MLKSFVVALFSMTILFGSLAEAKSSSSSGSSKSYSFSSSSSSKSSSSKSYSFGGSSSNRSSSSSSYSSSSPSRNSFFSSPTPRTAPAPVMKYESRKSDALVQKGDASAKFYSTKKMEQDMANAGIKQKESVIATNKALNSMSSQPKVAPQAPTYQGYAYSRPPVTTYQSSAQPRTVIVEKHYHNDGPGLGTIIAGNMIGNALSRPHTPAPVVINNGNGGYQGQGNYPNQYQQNCSAFDGSCITSKYHFVNGIDF